MAEKGIPAFILFAVTVALVSAVTLFAWPLGLMLCLMNALAFGIEILVLRMTRPAVLRRKIPLDTWWDKTLPFIMALGVIASAALSVYDRMVLKISILSEWCFLLGFLLLMAAFVILAQSMRANAPHAKEKYGEEPAKDADRGPYDVVRHPVMLGVLFGGLSLPLIVGSGIGFAPLALLFGAVFARVAMEDDWRFNNYEWYYDYTKEVSYRLIPFIW